MADEGSGEAVGEAVAEIVETAVEGAAHGTAAALEAAEERIERAEEVAQEIVDAAHMNSIVQSVETFHGEIRTWRDQLQAENQTLRDRLESLEFRLTEMASSQTPPAPVVVTTEATPQPAPLIPEPLAGQVLSPESAEGVVLEAPAANPRQVRGKRFL